MWWGWWRRHQAAKVEEVLDRSDQTLKQVADVIIELRTTTRKLEQTLKELTDDHSS